MTLEKFSAKVLAGYYRRGLTSKNAVQVLAWINWRTMREAQLASPIIIPHYRPDALSEGSFARRNQPAN